MTFKKIEVVMLPTEDKTYDDFTSLMLCIKSFNEEEDDKAEKGDLQLGNSSRHDPKLFQPQHLYITVSQDVEPIKEGDWGYISIGINGTIGKVSYDKDNKTWDLTTPDNVHYPFSDRKYIKKIIATTDPKLINQSEWKGHHKSDECDIAQPSQSFIKLWCKLGGKGEFEAEYEGGCCGRCDGIDDKCIPTEVKLKVNSDNTINIRQIEEKMYSRAEVHHIIHRFVNDHPLQRGVQIFDGDIKDWIENNL